MIKKNSIILLLLCSSCIFWSNNKSLTKKGYTVEISRWNKQETTYSLDNKILATSEIERQLKKAIVEYTPVVMIVCGPNIKYRDLLKILEIIHQYNIKDIYIVVDESIQVVLKNDNVKYYLTFPNIEIKHSEQAGTKVVNERELGNEFATYFMKDHKEPKEPPSIFPIVKCSPEIQQYWLNKIIMNLNYYGPNGFILQFKNKNYKIKTTGGCNFKLYKLFQILEQISEPPEPPPIIEE